MGALDRWSTENPLIGDQRPVDRLSAHALTEAEVELMVAAEQRGDGVIPGHSAATAGPQTRLILAGTALHRISSTGSGHPPNSFKASGIRAPGHPLPGWFDLIDELPRRLPVRRIVPCGSRHRHPARYAHPAIGDHAPEMARRQGTHPEGVDRYVIAASLLDGDLRSLNLSGTLVGCDRGAYPWSRTTCHQILDVNPGADG